MERERIVYEESSADEENAFIEIGFELLERMDPPPGWTKHKKPGRPRKKHVGHPVEYPWKGMAMVLLLKTYLDFDYRKMAAHLKASPELIKRLNFEKAPSKSEIHRCMELFPESWIRQMNHLVAEEFKKNGVVPPSQDQV
jgi:hypothetical protein